MSQSEIIIYQNPEGNIKIDVRLTVRKFQTVQTEGSREVERDLDHRQ